MSEWESIKTAPRDGTMVLGTNGRSVVSMWWDDRDSAFPWAIVDGAGQINAWMEAAPTHWMPLPEPPK